MSILVRWIDRWSQVVGTLGALVIVPLVLSMVYEVIARYVFSAPTYWAFEVSYMMMGVIFLFALGNALRLDQHVNVDVVHARLPRRVAAAIDAFACAIMTGLCAWLTYALFNHVLEGYRSGEGSGVSAWNPKIWPYRIVFLVGFATLMLATLAKLVRSLAVLLGLKPIQERT